MYHSPSDDFERQQWTAWAAYMTAWSSRTNFQFEWASNRNQFDSNFAKYIDGLVESSPAPSGAHPLASQK
jgi:hypothetical protein